MLWMDEILHFETMGSQCLLVQDFVHSMFSSAFCFRTARSSRAACTGSAGGLPGSAALFRPRLGEFFGRGGGAAAAAGAQRLPGPGACPDDSIRAESTRLPPVSVARGRGRKKVGNTHRSNPGTPKWHCVVRSKGIFLARFYPYVFCFWCFFFFFRSFALVARIWPYDHFFGQRLLTKQLQCMVISILGGLYPGLLTLGASLSRALPLCPLFEGSYFPFPCFEGTPRGFPPFWDPSKNRHSIASLIYRLLGSKMSISPGQRIGP